VWHAGFIWDDQAHVTNNLNLRSVRGLWRVWFEPEASQQYYPLQLTSYWVEFHLWGLQPRGYHLVNVLLHAGNAILLWQVLRRLEVPGAWLAGAIFAVHPVEVESVAWISERKNVLSGMFYLLALLALLRYRPLTAVAGEHRKSDWRFYLLGLFLFVCALLSKTVACSLPAVMALLIWWKNGRVEWRDVYALTPLFVIGAVLGLMTAWLEKHHVGAAGTDWSLTFVQRCLLAGRVLWFYAGKLVWPHPLSFVYSRWEIDARVWWQYLFPAAALAVLIALWLLRRRVGRGPLVAVTCFAGMLFPALGFFDVYPFRFSFVADHFQYLAGAGLIALVVSVGTQACRRTGHLGRLLGLLVALIVLTALASLSWARAHAYRDDVTLWRDTLAQNPRCWLAHTDLGYDLSKMGRVQEALSHEQEAVRLKPDYAEARNDLGVALQAAGRVQEAIVQYESALQINPHSAEAHCNLGNGLFDLGKFEEAIAQYEQALRIKPDYTKAHLNLADAHYRLAKALEQTGRSREAIGHYEQALALQPDFADACNNLAWLLATRAQAEGGDAVRAVELAQRACELTGNRRAGCLDTLAAAYAAAGRFREAVATAEKAIELARAASPPKSVGEYEARSELYRSGRAYRQPVDTATPNTP
jgi:tetratricopeptide (TPR) repeat protein